MKNKLISGFILFVSVLILATGNITHSAGLSGDDYYPIDTSEYMPYSAYYDKYSGTCRPDSITEISGTDYISAVGDFSTGECHGKNSLIWGISGGEITYSADISETGIYCMNINYYAFENNISSVEISVYIDNEIPYDSASCITLDKIWKDSAPVKKDSNGNQVRPEQVQYAMWQSKDLNDIYNEPLFFYLEKGRHEIKLVSHQAGIAIDSIKIYNTDDKMSYDKYISGNNISETPDNIFRIEGEDALYKSNLRLSPTCDKSHYNTSPADPVKILYNTFGAGNWNKAGQSATWLIDKSDIKYTGWYKIGIKCRQAEKSNIPSERRIYIDGNVPCEEMNDVKFPYNKKWSVVSPESDGKSIYIYLTADSDHTITLECISGERAGYIRKTDDIINKLNNCYRDIVMITGTSPDKYTDYYVHEKIPGLLDTLNNISSELEYIQDNIYSASGGDTSAISGTLLILEKCIDSPLKIPEYLQQIKESISSLSAWSAEYRKQPLEIDYIEFATAGVEFTSCKENFFKKIWFMIKSFFLSFFEDYSALSGISGENAIEVWVNADREQAEIVKELTDKFIAGTGVPVSVNLVTGGIVEASLAGKNPDIALFLGGEYPVMLAMRGLLADVSEFDDFEEITGRFQENALTHYRYNNGVYGLPITQNFPMLFYRTDILADLGFRNPPETWDNLIEMLPVLQRNYMSVGLVMPPADVSVSTETGHTFAMLMLQQGLDYYDSGLEKSLFDTPEAVRVFETWTDFYTKYTLPQSYDAFSRFRTGEYPIVISDYSFYGILTDASPEIKGLWSFCPVPATVTDNGVVSHSANSNVSGAVIFSDTKDLINSWEYIKWFTSDDIQTDLGNRTESLFGTMGRYCTANTQALKNLPWSENELQRLFTQRNELKEIPIIPASYSVTRNIMNAFRDTVNQHANPRDTLLWYNNDINDEISRKNKEMSYSD